MTTELAALAFEAMSRVLLALAVAFIGWIVLGQKPNCPTCGSPIDKPVTHTRAQQLGEVVSKP
jgi:hypothetical protein